MDLLPGGVYPLCTGMGKYRTPLSAILTHHGGDLAQDGHLGGVLAALDADGPVVAGLAADVPQSL